LPWVALRIGCACDPNFAIAITKKALRIDSQLEGVNLAVRRMKAVDPGFIALDVFSFL
jgi:hypothetical protein